MNETATLSVTTAKLALYAYAISNGADANALAPALNLPNPPETAAAVWAAYAALPRDPRAARLTGGHGAFMYFAVSLALALELDPAVPAAARALNGEPSAAFAIRLFSASADEAAAWRAAWLCADKALIFADAEALKLRPNVLRYLLGASSSHADLPAFATRVNTAFSWGDLVLPPPKKELLRHICDRAQYDDAVYNGWGFSRKVPYGRGARALFSGPPGTGKTMAALVVAHELGRELYRVDLSAMFSKYIGETEKNMDALFREAANTDAVLFFDEADAVFGKRGAQKDSHDKYANMQTSFLLQRFEDYAGIAILATNFVSNLDPAFIRRIQVRVEFPQPDEPSRLAIWRALLAAPLPVSGDIDLPFIAKTFELSGAEIKNVSLTAAFLAAAGGGGVSMRHIARAVCMEYEKIGKLFDDKVFADYL